MPNITVQGKTFHCEKGSNLRQMLLKNQIPVHNDNAKIINCRGIGTCGTCAVAIAGEVSALGWKEQARLSLPPHQPGTTRRLACQVKVLEDIRVRKFDGFWGQGDRLNY